MSLVFGLRAGDPSKVATPLLAVALPSEPVLPRALGALDRKYRGALSRAIKAQDFKGGRDEALLLLGPGAAHQIGARLRVPVWKHGCVFRRAGRGCV